MSVLRRYVEQMTRIGDEMCAHLHLVDYQEHPDALGRYFLKPALRGGFTWVEIVVLQGGSVLVHGDCDTVIFSSYYRPTHPRQVIDWIATSDCDYAEQKAAIGGSQSRIWSEELVTERVLQWRREKLVTAAQARQLVEVLKDGGQESFLTELHSFGHHELTSHHFGMVPAPRVFSAQAALRKLKKLLLTSRASGAL